MTAPELVWTVGHRWTRFDQQLRDRGQFTVVTWNAETFMFDLDLKMVSRLRQAVAAASPTRIDVQPCENVPLATPCGLIYLDDITWYPTHRVVLISTECTRHWADNPDGSALVSTLRTVNLDVRGHPHASCGAYYCNWQQTN